MAIQEKKLIFNILIKKDTDQGCYIAHCLELDIVATSKRLREVKRDIINLIDTQVDYSFSNNNLANLYHSAPIEVWQEFYKCKKIEESNKKIKSHFSKDNSFIPPFITTNICEASTCYA